MPIPVSFMHSTFGCEKKIEIVPVRVYLSAFERSCSMTKQNHLSSVIIRGVPFSSLGGVYERLSFLLINSDEKRRID